MLPPVTEELLNFYAELIHQHSDPTVRLETEVIDEVYGVYAVLIRKRKEM